MDEHTQQPPPRPRRRRPNGRWSNPASPLQAARFERRQNGRDVVSAIRRLCPGHSGQPCRIDLSKLSDYENLNRRPGITHIEAFARYYERSPEELGLIHWRDDPAPEPEPAPPVTAAPRQRDLDQDQVVLEWLRASAVTVATAVLEVLAQCPVKIPAEPNGQETAPGDDSPEDDSPDDDPPAGAAVPE